MNFIEKRKTERFVVKSCSSGTPKLGKGERFAKVSGGYYCIRLTSYPEEMGFAFNCLKFNVF